MVVNIEELVEGSIEWKSGHVAGKLKIVRWKGGEYLEVWGHNVGNGLNWHKVKDLRIDGMSEWDNEQVVSLINWKFSVWQDKGEVL